VTTAPGPYYLFVRILEACNANCFMCQFARSTDSFRGEPLLHPELTSFVVDAQTLGLKSSIITNGFKLARIVPDLARVGLDQVIVSIDGAHSQSHDKFRGTPSLFARCIEGIKAAKRHGLHVRVNSVVGPHNFEEMADLQTLLTTLAVDQWELSSLKLEKRLDYSELQVREILGRVVPLLYEQRPKVGFLKPLGKAWCGDTPDEQREYFLHGITPRPDNICLVVHRVRYYDMKAGILYPCSLLPHRPYSSDAGDAIDPDWQFTVQSERMARVVKKFEVSGPVICTGCSTSAAGFGNALSAGHENDVWSY
jgi:cytosylglucuronate decarboxylase